MAENIACPNCQRKLQIPDEYLGQKVQCPDCNHTFTATASSITAEPIPPTSVSSVPPPEERDDDKPRRRRYEDDDDDDDLSVRKKRHQAGDVPNYLTQSIVITLCCCWPVGIVAIINAAKVNGLLASGDYDGAVQASEAAKKWCWVSFVLGLIVNVLYVVVQIMTEGRNF